MNAGPFLLVWSSGHHPPVPVYYTENKGKFGAEWGATYDRHQATRFSTKSAAKAAWDAVHQWPEDYQHCWGAGIVRAEPNTNQELCLVEG